MDCWVCLSLFDWGVEFEVKDKGAEGSWELTLVGGR